MVPGLHCKNLATRGYYSVENTNATAPGVVLVETKTSKFSYVRNITTGMTRVINRASDKELAVNDEGDLYFAGKVCDQWSTRK